MRMRPSRLLLLLVLLAQGQAAEVALHRWSGSLNVPDPVACAVDEAGRVYVTATTRRKVADLDIREHPLWIPDDVGLTSVEAKRAFLQRELATGKLHQPRGGLRDHNQDGSIDWRDLTVHSERIYQLRDTDGDGTADKMTVFAEGFNTEVTGIAAGILWHDGWLYATIAPDLWRFKDTDDDGVADIREVVVHGFGIHLAYAGHDMHGPRLGPDGRIYWSIGDKGVNVTDKNGKVWAYPHEGAVLRVEPDGSGFEVFAHGLRNVQEVAFDDFGNLFGVDNDADLAGERERLVYIVQDSDSGWRCGHQYMKEESRWFLEDIWKPQSPWQGGPSRQPLFITPPLANTSDGPAGFVREPGTALGKSLRAHFLLNQFPSGRMETFTLEPDGVAFKAIGHRLVNSGVMGIGMAWGIEGALYMADWDGGYPLDEKGGVWSVDVPVGDRDMAARQETLNLLAAGLGSRSESELQHHLGHADQRVRLAAELELAKRGLWQVLLKVAGDATRPRLARVHAIWGVGIGLRRGQVAEAVVHDLLAVTDDAELQCQLAKILGDAKASVASTRVLSRLLTSESARVRFHAGLALGHMAPAFANLSLAKVELNNAAFYLLDRVERDAPDPWLRHALVGGLAGCMSAEELASRHDSESEPVRLLCALALARQRSPQITAYLDDPADVVRDEVARAIHDDAGLPEALPKLAALLDAERPLTETVRRRVINANLRLGQPVNAARLLQYALHQEPALAREAFQALNLFSKPPRLDRVDGTAGTYPRLDDKALSPALIETWKADLLALADPVLKAAVLELFIQLEIDLEPGVLQGFIADTSTAPPLRAGALRLLAARHAATPAFAEAVRVALGKSAPEALRIDALGQLAKHRPAEALAEFDRVLASGSLKEKQAVLGLAATLENSAADAWVEDLLRQLGSDRAEPELRLDILEAAQARPGLASSLTTFQQTRQSAPVQDLLEGGDPERGRDLATNHLGANCLACHLIEAKEGSAVGPSLKGIGAQRSRAELLESLVNPAAVISPGYGLVSLTLKDGTNVAGSLVSDKAEALEFKLPDGSLRRVDTAAISQKSPAMSVMPPMLGILKPAEVRDLVAYLASLKTGIPKAPEKQQPDLARSSAKKAPSEARPKPEPKPVAKAAPKPVPVPEPKSMAKAPAPKPPPITIPPAKDKPVMTGPATTALPEPPRLELPKATPAKAVPTRSVARAKSAPKTQPPATQDPVTVITNAPVQPAAAAMTADIPRAEPVEESQPKRGFSLRFGNRRKEEPVVAPPTAAAPAMAVPSAAPPAPAKAAEPATAAAKTPPVPQVAAKATPKAVPQTAPKDASTPPEPPRAIPVEDDATMAPATPAKRGLFSRFRDASKK